MTDGLLDDIVYVTVLALVCVWIAWRRAVTRERVAVVDRDRFRLRAEALQAAIAAHERTHRHRVDPFAGEVEGVLRAERERRLSRRSG